MRVATSQAKTRPVKSIPFELPPIEPAGVKPIWDGVKFVRERLSENVLEYGISNNGWNDDLTVFHEEAAGANHFIDVASRQHALGQIEQRCTVPKPVLLEIGCSSGFMLSLLDAQNKSGTTIGADIVREPLEQLAKQLPGVPLMRFDLTECPLPDNCIDAVVALNVLEHIEQDAAAVSQMYRILKPGGIAVLEVPAGPELYDNYDRMLMHFRRYEMSAFRQLLEASKFKIEYASHLGCFIYPAFWIVKQLSKLKSSSAPVVDTKAVEKDIKRSGSNTILSFITRLELNLGKSVSYPFGIRCLVTCRK